MHAKCAFSEVEHARKIVDSTSYRDIVGRLTEAHLFTCIYVKTYLYEALSRKLYFRVPRHSTVESALTMSILMYNATNCCCHIAENIKLRGSYSYDDIYIFDNIYTLEKNSG